MYRQSTFEKPDAGRGVMQIVHDFQFVALNLKSDMYTFAPETSLDERREHIGTRLRRLKARGYAGVVMSVDNRRYLEDAEALELMAWAVDMAHELGLRVWLYDEQYYPTGAAGGLTLRDHPELDAMALACVEKRVEVADAPVRILSPLGHSPLKYAYAEDARGELYDISRWRDPAGNLCWDAPRGKWHILCFFLRPLYEGTYLPLAYRAPRRCPCVSDAKAISRFLDVTYTPYERALGERLGNKIEAVFTDEPSNMEYREYPSSRNPDASRGAYPSCSIYDRPHTDMPIYPFIPWPSDICDRFESEHGYPLCLKLTELFGDDIDSSRDIRRAYFETLSNMFDTAYNAQYISKLRRFNMLYSGHWLGEEDFARHSYLYGDLMRNMGRQDIPGCDLLYSEPDKVRHSIAVKLASSAAHQYGKAHCMIEASNMYDKDQALTLKRLKLTIAAQYALGIDTITSYYGEELFDEAAYRRFADYAARLSELLEGGMHVSQALIYLPYEQLASLSTVAKAPVSPKAMALQASIHNLNEALLRAQVDYDFINKEMLTRCAFRGGEIITPCGETPRALIFPPIDFVDAPVANAIRYAIDANVRVIIDGQRRAIKGLDNLSGIEFTPERAPLSSWDFIIEDEPFITCYHRKSDCQQVYLLVNTGINDIDKPASIPDLGGALTLLDLDSGAHCTLNHTTHHARARFNLKLPSMTACALAQSINV